MKSIKEMVEVMQAFDNGARVQYASHDVDEWLLVESPTWNWFYYDYRVAPKEENKVKMYRALFRYSGVKYYASPFFYRDEDDAKIKIGTHFVRILPKTMIEVEA